MDQSERAHPDQQCERHRRQQAVARRCRQRKQPELENKRKHKHPGNLWLYHCRAEQNAAQQIVALLRSQQTSHQCCKHKDRVLSKSECCAGAADGERRGRQQQFRLNAGRPSNAQCAQQYRRQRSKRQCGIVPRPGRCRRPIDQRIPKPTPRCIGGSNIAVGHRSVWTLSGKNSFEAVDAMLQVTHLALIRQEVCNAFSQICRS